MLKSTFTVDYQLYKKKMGLLANKLVPFAEITTKQLAEIAKKMIEQKTGETAIGATDLKDLWVIDHTRKQSIEEFVIRNTYSNQDVILWREMGTKPHEITPKNKKFLHFFIGNAEIFTKLVKHPCTKAYGMIHLTEEFMKTKMNWWQTQVFKAADKIQKQGR